MSPAPMTPDPMTIMARCDQAAEDLDATLADGDSSPAEQVAALACQVMVDGLRTVTPVDDVWGRWMAVLHVLEALHLADTVGRRPAHVYRATYRILAGNVPARTSQEG